VVLAATATGVYCGTNGNSCRDDSTTPPTIQQVDGVRPKPDVDTIVAYINRITLSNRTLQYPANETAEERALQWLIDEDMGTAPSNQVALRQRYVMATLRFGSTSTINTTDTIIEFDSYIATWANASVGECQWQGVKCAKKNDDGVVTRLELSGVDVVSGRIPDDLGLLTDLTELMLFGQSWNGLSGLTGTIPSSLAQLTGLSMLSLSYNALTGTIPSSLETLTDLTYLVFTGNVLNGTIPLWLESLTALNMLDLEDNALTGTIPSSLARLPGLARLSLGGNALTGTIPSSLAQMTGLSYLSLGGNTLTGTIPSSLETLTGLADLELFGNALTGTIPSTMASLTFLSYLVLSHNAFNGTIPSLFESLTSLFHLDLSYNALTGTIPSSLETLTDLELLLHGNQLNGTGSFCNSINASSQSDVSYVYLVADCYKMSCPCCTYCCPTGRDGIPVYEYCFNDML
jgi:Leucine-rich repeat (LRR) protein